MKKTITNDNDSLKSLDHSGMKRRDFFKLLGGGIFIFFQPWDPFELFDFQTQQRRSLPTEFNAFLHIAEDGSVNCYTGKIEMGQGAITSLAQIMADEIDVPFEKVKMVMGDTDMCPWDGGTNGSASIRTFSPRMRVAAAEAKTVLMQMASDYLHVPVTQLEVKDGIISDSTNSKSKVGYGELAKGKRIEKHLDGKPELKDYTKFRYAGKPFLHQDARIKVTGEAKYAADFQLPGLLHARILRPPSHGAKLLTADVSEAQKIKGIQVVRDGDLIAILSDDRDLADLAIVKVKAEYSFDEINVDDKSIFDRILKAGSVPNVLKSNGDLEAGKKSSDILTESEFHNSYVAHAPMEPHAATALIEGDKITVWVSNQGPYRTQETIAREMNVPLEKVRIITPFVGGGFGGKSAHNQAVEAVKLAEISG